MEETLYDKIMNAIHQTVDTKGNGQDEVECAKACTNVALQAQIDENISILEMAKLQMNERVCFVLRLRINE